MFHNQVDLIKLGNRSIFIEEQLMAKMLISCCFLSCQRYWNQGM
jgi:hypothetical protein